MRSRRSNGSLLLATRRMATYLIAACWIALASPAAAAPSGRPVEAGWHFVEVAVAAGVQFDHTLPDDVPLTEPMMMHGGAAAGDLDGDGWLDLVAVRGPALGNALYRNRSDGTFEEIGAASGLRLAGSFTHGVALGDVDGDGDLDVLFGGISGTPPRLFANRGDASFDEITEASGLISNKDTFCAAFGDIDLDGDLDLFLSHWSGAVGPQLPPNHLWRNDGAGHFSPIDFLAGVAPLFLQKDWSFTPAFTDLDADGDVDLLLTSDFGTSQVLLNLGDGTFAPSTEAVISDENGMGSAVGDFDGDGRWDWFVSSIWDPDGVPEGNWGLTGNRLYRGLGDGTFEDVTEASGVRQGYWGWGSCAGDFDLDGDLDLFHVNGFPAPAAVDFHDDPARLFINRGDGTFDEFSEPLGVDDRGQGRGVVCFDFDLDGDLDFFVTNNRGSSRLFRNDLETARHWLRLDLRQGERKVPAVGAEVRFEVGGRQILRQVEANNNFISQSPHVIHVGLGDAAVVDEIEITWPGGEIERHTAVAADRSLLLVKGRAPVIEIPALGPESMFVLACALLAAGGLTLYQRRR